MSQNVGQVLINHIINHLRPANVLLPAGLKTVPVLSLGIHAPTMQCGGLCHISIIKLAHSQAMKLKLLSKIPEQLF